LHQFVTGTLPLPLLPIYTCWLLWLAQHPPYTDLTFAALAACLQPYLSPVQEGMVYTHPGTAYLQPQQQQYMAVPPMAAMYQQQMQYEDARASLDANAGKEEGGLQMACCSEATV